VLLPWGRLDLEQGKFSLWANVLSVLELPRSTLACTRLNFTAQQYSITVSDDKLKKTISPDDLADQVKEVGPGRAAVDSRPALSSPVPQILSQARHWCFSSAN